MTEVADASVKLLIGASVYLGDEATWEDYLSLYKKVYLDEGLRVLRPDGYFVVIQTDQYKGGRVVPRNAMLVGFLSDDLYEYELLDTKVWKRKKSDFFQPPFSLVWVFVPPGGTAPRPKKGEYLEGVWDYPQTAGGRLNAYPEGLCRLLVNALTQEGDLVVDPFAGSALLLGTAARAGRRAVGYEIDTSLKETIDRNLGVGLIM